MNTNTPRRGVFVYNCAMEEILTKLESGSCFACSDFPAPHGFTYISATFEAWSNDWTARFFRKPNDRFARAMFLMGDAMMQRTLQLCMMLRILRASDDIEKSQTNRTRVIWKEARTRNIHMQQLLLLRTPLELHRAYMNGRWVYFQSIPIPKAIQRAETLRADDKLLFKQTMQRCGIPVARGFSVRTIEEARHAWNELNQPVVVKPRIGSRARHTTPYIRTWEDLSLAFFSAKILCHYVMLEEHLFGSICRATVVNGVLRGFLQKNPPRITGDGVHTVRELVELANDTKRDGVWQIIWGEEHDTYVARQGLTASTILEKGVRIDISRHSGRQVGGDSHEMPGGIHSKLREYIERAARELGVPVVGFDMIIADATKDPDAQRWGMLEANSLPYIDLHYAPLEGEPSNVAAHVWDLWNEQK